MNVESKKKKRAKKRAESLLLGRGPHIGVKTIWAIWDLRTGQSVQEPTVSGGGQGRRSPSLTSPGSSEEVRGWYVGSQIQVRNVGRTRPTPRGLLPSKSP